MIKVSGLSPTPDALIQRLDDYAEDLDNKATTGGMTAAAKPVKDYMKKVTPVQPGGGALKRSIGQAQLSRRARATLQIKEPRAILVGPVRKVADPLYHRNPGKKIAQGYKAYWLESTGSKAHDIPFNRARSKRKVLKFAGSEGVAYRTKVSHPGMRPTRFVSRSLRATESQIPDLFFKGMNKRLDKYDLHGK